MSQEKVDKYKKEKANRAKTMKKEKIRLRIEIALTCLVLFMLVGWVGYSVYTTASSSKEVVATDINLDAITDYLSSLD
ncbi:hypothetical protein SAMN05216249_1105 [Acetitomaculum ruminis DSM 5522]|uniref:Uncharacterized protein n=1 Tax=Acetitomaculum ruminis DSM 5522 TaxID=1120918 RepID=A0A1I0YJ34_9FIRM|nr:hypothetical protein [Acetitomaculum ruminis]SFB12338.1 hypothetical protein SAMN05216249_1105 [Acetitomaculum ruminis DSM 5522]